MKQDISNRNNFNGSGLIEDLINELKKYQDKGATHYDINFDCTPGLGHVSLSTYKIMTEEERIQKELEQLEVQKNMWLDRLNRIKSNN